MLEKTLESPLDCKDIKPVNSIENQPWVIRDWKVWSIKTLEGLDAEARICWPPDEKSQLIGKDPDTGEDWRQKENRTTEDEMVR